MAGKMADEMAHDYLDWVVGRTPSGHTALPQTTVTHYLLLTTVNPVQENATAADLTEVSSSGTAYARIALGTTYFASAAAGGSISNTAEILFATATAPWGTIEGWAVVEGTGSTAKIIQWCDDPPSVAVGSGDTYKFPIGNLILTAD